MNTNNKARRGFMAALLALLPLLLVPGAAEAAGIKWEKSYSAAQARAKATGKPIMVDFYTEWCGWCKRLDKDTYTDAQVVKAANQYVSVKVDAEREGSALAKKYSVSGFPTILFLNPNGTVAGRIGGYMPGKPFAAEMNRIVSAARALPVLEAKFKANPRDGAAAAKLAALYADNGDRAKAAKALGAAERSGAAAGLAPAYNALGDLYGQDKDFARAASHYKKAIATSRAPKDADRAYVGLALSHLQRDDLKTAAPILKEAISSRKTSVNGKADARELLNRVEEFQRKQR